MAELLSIKTLCPYCAKQFTTGVGSAECPHCGKPLYGVPCPKCDRRTLNLTDIPRYGKATCFACHTEVAQVPGASMPKEESPVRKVVEHPASAPRAAAVAPAQDSRTILDKCVTGLERVMQDREMLLEPEMRAVVTRMLDDAQTILHLDDQMRQQEWVETQFQDADGLERISRLIYQPVCGLDYAILPAGLQRWTLALDDAIRHWQFAQRARLAEDHQLALIPAIPGITLANTTNHIFDLPGVITAVEAPGFALRGEVLRKASVLTA